MYDGAGSEEFSNRKRTIGDKNKNLPDIRELSGLGLEFCFIIVISVFSGNYLDERFDISPLFLLIFSMGGFAFGIYYILKRSKGKQE
ncbi:MAG: AtpZ/AtpI family protein [Leptospira sp.]|nr:AtpZ/AtpI family protein [Leptospira sp.]